MHILIHSWVRPGPGVVVDWESASGPMGNDRVWWDSAGPGNPIARSEIENPESFSANDGGSSAVCTLDYWDAHWRAHGSIERVRRRAESAGWTKVCLVGHEGAFRSMAGVTALPNAGLLVCSVSAPVVPALSPMCRRSRVPHHSRASSATPHPTTKAVPEAVVKQMIQRDVRDIVVVLSCSDETEATRRLKHGVRQMRSLGAYVPLVYVCAPFEFNHFLKSTRFPRNCNLPAENGLDLGLLPEVGGAWCSRCVFLCVCVFLGVFAWFCTCWPVHNCLEIDHPMPMRFLVWSGQELDRVFGDQCSTVTECNIDMALAWGTALRPDLVAQQHRRVVAEKHRRRSRQGKNGNGSGHKSGTGHGTHRALEVDTGRSGGENQPDQPTDDALWRVLPTPASGDYAIVEGEAVLEFSGGEQALAAAKQAAEDGGYCAINYAPKRGVAIVRDVMAPPTARELSGPHSPGGPWQVWVRRSKPVTIHLVTNAWHGPRAALVARHALVALRESSANFATPDDDTNTPPTSPSVIRTPVSNVSL